MSGKQSPRAGIRRDLMVAVVLIAVLFFGLSFTKGTGQENYADLQESYTVLVQPNAVAGLYQTMVGQGIFSNHSATDKASVLEGPLGDIAVVTPPGSNDLAVVINNTVAFGPVFFQGSDIDAHRFGRMIFAFSQAQERKYDSVSSLSAAKKAQGDGVPVPAVEAQEQAIEKPEVSAKTKKEHTANGLKPLNDGQLDELRALLKKRLQGEGKTSESSTAPDQSESSQEGPEAAPSGTVDVSKIDENRTTVFYAGNEIPKIGYNTKEEMMSPDRRRAQVKMMLSKIAEKGESWSVVYPAKGETRKTIAIFGDPTCPFCQTLHEAIPTLQDMGVQVHYLFYNRNMASGSAIPASARAGNRLMQNAWCAGNSARALDHAMEGYMTPGVDCSNLDSQGKTAFPGNEHFLMGRILGMRGTPYTITDDGKVIVGLNSHARNPVRDYIERIGL